MTITAINRQSYSQHEEKSPSRFVNEGRTYRDWATRADQWAATNKI